MTTVTRAAAAVLLFAAAAGAMVPLEGDRIIHDGLCSVADGSWSMEFAVDPGARPFGFYLNVEGIEEFDVVLNDVEVKHVLPGETPRTRVRTVDLSEWARLLEPGRNRLEIRSAAGVSGFWCRAWTSSHAWLLGTFHSHTRYSDGVKSVHDLLKMAATDGADFCAVTDHNTLRQCRDTAFRATPALMPIRGLEWTTDSGHANVLGLAGEETIELRSVREMIDDASYRGGLVQVNHPMLGSVEWLRYPVWDPGLDIIEIFNRFNWALASTGRDNGDAEAVLWWQRLLAEGLTIAAAGNSDYHGLFPQEYALCPGTRVFVPAAHGDTILKYLKLGRAMVCDRQDDSRLYVYADGNADGRWDVVMGDHVRSPGGTQAVRFRLEVEDADRASVVSLWDRTGEFYRHPMQDGGDHQYEWYVDVGRPTPDFVRAELRTPGEDDPLPYFEICTNPIYINHGDYPVGPLELAVETVRWPESLRVGWEDTLRVRLANVGGYSPYRFGLEVACDTTQVDVTGWQETGPGVGGVKHGADGRFETIEWQGGYAWQNRLAEGKAFDYWLTVEPKGQGVVTVLLRGWADDRLFQVACTPDTGVIGPDGRCFRAAGIAAAPAGDGGQGAPIPAATALLDVRPRVAREAVLVPLTVAAGEPVATLRVHDVSGRTVATLGTHGLGPGFHEVEWRLGGDAGSRVAPGVYFVRLATAWRRQAVRLVVVE